ncbi:phage portal protein [Cellulomonas timonensis]|uniref:phage portal protein n=1 Tax=Cellulomonas timonensis TaxID=1689271 RepID=UPI00082D1A70|nr:phage portal protein [Cellulomonas timonensis]
MSLLFGPRNRALTWQDVWGGGGPSAEDVRGDRAYQVIPVYSAISQIADSLSTMPIGQYEGGPGATRREVATPSPIVVKPDPTRERVDWLHQGAGSALLRGNAFGLVTGVWPNPTSVTWLHPDRVYVDETGVEPLYHLGVPGQGKPARRWPHGPILHVPAFTVAGSWKGLSPLELFMLRFETWAMSAGYGHDWFKSNARPSGVLQNLKASLTKRQVAETKDQYLASVRAHEPVVLDQNWSWTELSIKPGEAQFLETIKATSTQIAAIYKVAPEDVGGESGSSKTYSNREQDQARYNVRALLPWIVRFEAAITSLLARPQYVKFNMDALSRPDLLTRMQAHEVQLRTGVETLEEARAAEDRPPLDDEQIAAWLSRYAKAPQPGQIGGPRD